MNQVNYKSPVLFPEKYVVSNVISVRGNSSMLREYFTGTVEGFMAGTPFGYRTVSDVISQMTKAHPDTSNPVVDRFGDVFTGTLEGERTCDLQSMWSFVRINAICYVFPNMKVNDYRIFVNPDLPDDVVVVNGRELKRIKKIYVVKVDDVWYVGDDRICSMPLTNHRKYAKEFLTVSDAHDYIFKEGQTADIKRKGTWIQEHAYIHEKNQNRPDSVQPGFVAPQPDVVRRGGVV